MLHSRASLKGRCARHQTTRTPRCTTISSIEYADRVRQAGPNVLPVQGPYTHIIHPRRPDHRILSMTLIHKNMSTKQSREHSRLSGLIGRPILEPFSHWSTLGCPCPWSLSIPQRMTELLNLVCLHPHVAQCL
jgi:hypothetical protein